MFKKLTNQTASEISGSGAGCQELWFRSLGATYDGDLRRGHRLGERLNRKIGRGQCGSLFGKWFLNWPEPSTLHA
jgi:hypothetical protein